MQNTPEDIIETFKICSKFKDKTRFVKFLIVGFPGETWKTVKETANLIKKLQKYVPMEIFYANILWIFPGTEEYETMKKKELIDDSYWLTDRPAPYYTNEHSFEELTKMSNYLSLSGALGRGYVFTLKLIINKVLQNPSYQFKRLRSLNFGIKFISRKILYSN